VARSTGVILAIGGITLANESIFHGKPIDWRIPVATGLAAGVFALAEKGWEDGAVGVAWLALITVLMVRLNPPTPAPIESALAWWNQPSKG
jgi:hypothetical protein